MPSDMARPTLIFSTQSSGYAETGKWAQWQITVPNEDIIKETIT